MNSTLMLDFERKDELEIGSLFKGQGREAQKAGMKIANTFKRPVLNRTEKDKGAYSEIIFHLKEK
ncbi:hypothetical protein AGMMS49953_01340 [Endomicrobiia bacterium]|nr:hypothetical protein AGMMS49953_01340 [Endomicrobiia bacterium]